MELKTPFLAVDAIIQVFSGEKFEGIVLIERKNPPLGKAIPGGFVDYGESLESAVKREAKEETNLELKNMKLVGVYSEPGRDPRGHVISIVFEAEGEGKLKASDDAKEVRVFRKLPKKVAFDHAKILREVLS